MFISIISIIVTLIFPIHIKMIFMSTYKRPEYAIIWEILESGELVKKKVKLYYDILGEPHVNPHFAKDVYLCDKN